MVIREMSRNECLRMLAAARWARLACAHESQPYIVPVYLAYDEAFGCLYGFTTPGQKVEWMRANPLVCVEVDAIAADDQWESVIAVGRYEELPETPGSEGARPRAQERPRLARTDMPELPSDSRHYQCESERKRAWQVLQAKRCVWWEPGYAAWATRAHGDSAEPFVSVYYKICIDSVTGRKATRNARDAIFSAGPAPPAARPVGLFRGRLRCVFGGRSKT